MREEVLYDILLDLNKACDALYRYKCIEILTGYSVVPQAICLPRRYWDRITTVAKAGGYYGTMFKGYWGVTQVDPLPSTIFNVVVVSVMRH